jgi:hypothetical protein
VAMKVSFVGRAGSIDLIKRLISTKSRRNQSFDQAGIKAEVKERCISWKKRKTFQKE